MIDLPDLPPPLHGHAPRVPEPRTAPEARTPPWRTGPAYLLAYSDGHSLGHHVADAVAEMLTDTADDDLDVTTARVLRAVAHGHARAGRERDADELHRVVDEMAGPG